jgi:hypothetical protein
MVLTILNYDITEKYDDICHVEYYLDNHLCTVQLEVENLKLSDSEHESFIKAGKTGEGIRDNTEALNCYLRKLHNIPSPLFNRRERLLSDQEELLKSIEKIANTTGDSFLRGQLTALVEKYNSNTPKETPLSEAI